MQRFIGIVVGTAMQKTVKVCVERLVRHARCPSMVLRLKRNYIVDDPSEAAVIGDMVAIEYAGPISRTKFFRLCEIIKEARRYAHPVTGRLYTAPAAFTPVLSWRELGQPAPK